MGREFEAKKYDTFLSKNILHNHRAPKKAWNLPRVITIEPFVPIPSQSPETARRVEQVRKLIVPHQPPATLFPTPRLMENAIAIIPPTLGSSQTVKR